MSAVDPEVLGRLFERHAPALELYARQWSDSPQDIVQEAFLRLARQDVLPENVAAWLFRVVRNQAITFARKTHRQKKHETIRTGALAAGFHPHNDRDLDPVEVARALEALPLVQREIIVAHLWGRLTFDQIAEVTGTSASTAHRYYQAAILELRERLGVGCPSTNRIPIRK